MQSQQIMKRDVKCVSPTATVREAARIMRDEQVGFLPVCKDDKKVIGTITDRDIVVRLLADGKPIDTPIKDIMTKQVVTASVNDDLEHVEELMAQNCVSRIVVVDGNRTLIGVISLSDVAVEESGDRASETLRQVSEREVRH